MVDSKLIDFRDIRKGFRDKVVLDKINLTVNKGEIFGIIGLSGSGKTTLFNILMGFLEPDEGGITYFDSEKPLQIIRDSEIVKKNFGFATQYPSFYPRLTAEENLDHFGALYKIKKISGSSI